MAEQEPVPDMTGVVDTTFDDKVRQHATTEMQVTAAQMQKQYEEIRRELDVLNKQRGDDQRRIEKLGQDNAALAEQVKALGANPVTATGEPVPQTPASPPGPEGEPQPGNTPVSFPPQGSVAVPPPTAFYPGNGVTPPPQVFARQGEVMNPLQYVPFNQTLYFINGDDPAQVAWMKRQTPPTLESKIILVQGSIPEMQKALDSRIYFDQNGVLCQRLGIDQVPARVSAVPGARFLKVEFIPAEEGRK
ncbi:traW domain protein [Escherichia coli 2-177-06_S4_C3]|nr:traW domain protein [Escherichia coli 2-177-06_S4_C3]